MDFLGSAPGFLIYNYGNILIEKTIEGIQRHGEIP